jgi:hypothetical protein
MKIYTRMHTCCVRMREYYRHLIALLLGYKEQADNLHYERKLVIMSTNVGFLNC